MNPRIRELADQANGPNPFYGTLKGQMTLLGDDAVEKFAELIVRECCDQFDKHPYVGTKRTQYIYGYIQGRVDAEQQIKQHFGVEL